MRNTANKQAEARRLRLEEGMPYPEIAGRVGVTERTVIRWSKIWGQPTGLPTSQSGVPQTESENRWPGSWTADDLIDLPDFRRELWEANLNMVRDAEALGNYRVGWFFKNLVEFARRQGMPDGSLDWSVAIAGLPVLAEWLDCPPCIELAEMAERLHPWEGNILSRRRAAYRQEARSIANSVKQCVLQASAQMVMADFAEGRQSPVTLTLAAFGERVPIFDRVPRGSKYRKINLGGIILGILASPKGERNV